MRVAASVLAAVALMGCGLLPAGTPDWVTNRPELPACGTEDGGFDLEARTCLLESFEAGRGAELISTQSTIEGDPITQYLRVHLDGTIEIFVDATQDEFGSGEWQRIRCRDLIAVEEFDDPPDRVLPAAMVFVEDGCEEMAT